MSLDDLQEEDLVMLRCLSINYMGILRGRRKRKEGLERRNPAATFFFPRSFFVKFVNYATCLSQDFDPDIKFELSRHPGASSNAAMRAEAVIPIVSVFVGG